MQKLDLGIGLFSYLSRPTGGGLMVLKDSGESHKRDLEETIGCHTMINECYISRLANKNLSMTEFLSQSV